MDGPFPLHRGYEPPSSVDELLSTARSLAGRTLGELAEEVGTDVPLDLRRKKGWVGQLMEARLGAYAGSKPVPDFEELGVELKTMSIGSDGKPMESTYVCAVRLSELHDLHFKLQLKLFKCISTHDTCHRLVGLRCLALQLPVLVAERGPKDKDNERAIRRIFFPVNAYFLSMKVDVSTPESSTRVPARNTTHMSVPTFLRLHSNSLTSARD